MQSEDNQKFTALQVQVLNELGIELWVPRENPNCRAKVVADPIQGRSPDSVSEVVSIVSAIVPRNDVSRQSVVFDLVCMRNSHLLLVAQTSGESDEGLLGSLIRVSDTRVKGEKFVFKWPQLDTNSGIDAARKAFLAFTSVQASNLESPVLVIFGREAASLLTKNIPEPAAGLPPELSIFDWNQFGCIAVPDVESLRLHWKLKRDLCMQLVKHCPAMFKLQPTNSQPNSA